MPEQLAAELLELDPDVGPRAAPHSLGPLTEIALVAIGGAAGSLARGALEAVAPAGRGWPWTTMGINVAGAWLLAILLAAVAFTSRRAQGARLLLGTGLLGGFTTFSTFAVEAVELTRRHQLAEASAYVAVSVLGALLAALWGLAVGRAVRSRLDRRSAMAPVRT